MSGYRELRDGYNFNDAGSESTGTRIFIEDEDGSEDLPSRGDSFSVAHSNVICDSIKEEPYHYDDDGDKLKYTCSYSVDESSESYVPSEDLKDYSKAFTFNGGQEVASTSNDTTNWYWGYVDGNNVVVESGGKVQNQKIYKRITVGSVTKELLCEEEGGYSLESFYLNHIVPKIGKINREELDSSDWMVTFPIGSVLFSSWDCNGVKDENETFRWLVSLNFTYRLLAINGDDATPYSWNYFWRSNTQSVGDNNWQYIVDTSITPSVDDGVFELTNFMSSGGGFSNILGTR